MNITYNYEVKNIDENKYILEYLKKYGICIVRNYIPQDNLNKVINEFNSVLSDDSGKININHPGNKEGLVCTVTKEELKNFECHLIVQYFYSEKLKNITDIYYPDGHNFNRYIFLTHEKEDENPILPWHHDRIQALKFYLNIIDVTADDGAFEYVPGSHKYGYYRANYYIATGWPAEEIPNDIPDEEILNPETIEVNAGDLIIFDADGFHRGGVVKPGHERKVIRAHTNPMPYHGYAKPRLFSKHWWIQSPFNFARLYRDSIGRVMGNEFKPGTSQGKYRH